MGKYMQLDKTPNTTWNEFYKQHQQTIRALFSGMEKIKYKHYALLKLAPIDGKDAWALVDNEVAEIMLITVIPKKANHLPYIEEWESEGGFAILWHLGARAMKHPKYIKYRQNKREQD